MFHSDLGIQWYQVYPDSLPPWRVILKKPSVPLFLGQALTFNDDVNLTNLAEGSGYRVQLRMVGRG